MQANEKTQLQELSMQGVYSPLLEGFKKKKKKEDTPSFLPVRLKDVIFFSSGKILEICSKLCTIYVNDQIWLGNYKNNHT